MKGAAGHLGMHPFPGPAAIRSGPYKGLPGCEYCGFCTVDGCMVEAKGSTNYNAIPDAQKTGRLGIVPMARATKIEVDSNGRATGVTYLKDGQQIIPACRSCDPRHVRLRERGTPAAIDVEGVSQGALGPNRAGRSASTTSVTCTRVRADCFRASG